MKRKNLDGDCYIVLIDNEFAGWFNIPTGTKETFILRAALSSNPKVLDMSEINIDIPDLPAPGQGYIWNGKGFTQKENG